ncbi:unnamed protein product [Meloidogyne enterolobii]|uniref:Uncharacterized protein n=1 Tax=Meloidogyne enterolobii TaxID=390850 RepID=A0ACB0YAQ0_MELEN
MPSQNVLPPSLKPPFLLPSSFTYGYLPASGVCLRKLFYFRALSCASCSVALLSPFRLPL